MKKTGHGGAPAAQAVLAPVELVQTFLKGNEAVAPVESSDAKAAVVRLIRVRK